MEGIKRRKAKTVFLSRKVYEEMISHCISEHPLEACGLMSGKTKCDALHVMENIKHSPCEFEMDNDQLEHVLSEIKDRNEKLTGIYHSHPTDRAYPSKADITNIVYPKIPYFIVSLKNRTPQVKCFIIKGSHVEKVNIKLIE